MGPGASIGDRFKLQRQAGAGGMGTVFHALDLHQGRPVAVKLIADQSSGSIERFCREARVLASLRHPNILEFIDHGLTEEGKPYLVTEWLEGEDLALRLAHGPFSTTEALTLVAIVAEALAFAHAQGIVHRDVKPSNIFLQSGAIESVKLLDFGIARLTTASCALTGTNVAMGTPSYMAPEQARGARDVDARADIFSLGCVLFESLTGRPPFTAAHPMAVLAKVLFEDAPRPTEVRAELPASLDGLLARLLAKDPARRPADASTLALELRALAAAEGSRPPPASSSAARASSLTAYERRLVSVVCASGETGLARESPGASPNTETASPGVAAKADEPYDATALAPPSSASIMALQRAAERHGARLEFLRNGSITAVITDAGSPIDLAASAARCALAIRDLLPGAHIALATGWDVLAGAQPIGQVIDRAATLLQRSPERESTHPPPVQLDRMTVNLLGDHFEVTADERGLLLLCENEPGDETRKLLGKPTSCVGRDRELRLLEELFDECSAESVARAVLITAGPGVGKSRVRHELMRRLRARSHPQEIWVARGDSMRADAPFGLLGQIVRRTAGLVDGEPLEARRQKLAARVKRHVGVTARQRVTEFLGEMIGISFSDVESVQLRAARQDHILMGDQIRRAWLDYLEAECRASPVLIVLEDLHWGDRPTAELIDAALRLFHDQPLMVLALARPEVRKLFPVLWAERDVTEIRLGDLSRKACERLVREVLGHDISSETVAKLAERSAGNAFFLEELVRAEAEGRGNDVPETVLAMMQARFDRLEPEARRILRAGSVFGEVFWRSAAADLLGEGVSEQRLDAHFKELEHREIITRRPEATYQGQTEYLFRHALIREAAYEMLTERDRAIGHRLAGEWLERAGERNAVVIAQHFDRAGEPARAMDWYHRAAEQALQGNDLEAAIRRAERSVDCGASGEKLGHLRLLQATACNWRGSLVDGEQRAEEAFALLRRGSARWYEAAERFTWASGFCEHFEHFNVIEASVTQVSPDADAAEERFIALVALAERFVFHGNDKEADALVPLIEAAQRGLPREPTTAARIHVHRAYLASSVDELDENLRQLEIAVACYEEAGDLRSVCLHRGELGDVLTVLGAPERAEPIIRECISSAEQFDLKWIRSCAQYNLAVALFLQHRHEEASAYLTSMLERSDDGANARVLAGFGRTLLARAFLLGGNAAAAEREIRAALAHVHDLPLVRGYQLAALASILLARGAGVDALPYSSEAVQAFDEAGGVYEGVGDTERPEVFIRLTHAEVLEATGSHASACQAIATARDRLLARAARISDPVWRRSFLDNVPENRRTLALAREWLDEAT